MTVNLPPFPVDPATLDLLDLALDPRSHGDPDAETSSVWDLLRLMSEMAGSDTTAVAEQVCDGIVVMRDPHYHDHDVLKALIAEIRRLRREPDNAKAR
jgi:hypothetical protein